MKTERLNAKLLGVLVVLNIALIARLIDLDVESLFMDELRQVSYYRHGFIDIIGLAASQQQPPLDYWIGKIFTSVLDTDFYARLSSALFGVGSVVLLIQLVSRFCRFEIALASGLILSLLPFHVYFSQEARPYSIVIFFLLSTLLLLHRLLLKRKRLVLNCVLLFASCVAFLLSRALAPLVIVVTTVGMLGLYACWILVSRDGNNRNGLKSVWSSIGVLVFAAIVYLPFLRRILQSSRQYVDNTNVLDYSLWWSAFQNFDPEPLWQALIAQTEPLGLFIVLPYLISLVLYLVLDSRPHEKYLSLFMLLTPLAAFLHLFIFQAMTTNQFRPPYAIYLLPLVLMGTAWFFDRILDYVKSLNTTAYKTAGGLTLLAMVTTTSFALVESKQLVHRSDWRALSEHLQNNFGSETIVLFDTLVYQDTWEPGYYGIPRYYRGESGLIEARQVPRFVNQLTSRNSRPVLVIFEYRDYLLTRQSKYPIMRGYRNRNSDIQFQDTSLEIRRFNGFYVISLKDSKEVGLKGLSLLLNTILDELASSEDLLDLRIAASLVDRRLGQPRYLHHLKLLEEELPKSPNNTVKRQLDQLRASLEVSD